jgi:hypothetical protein
VSIYAGLTGPLFAVVDPRVSGESAILDAIRLVAAGVAPRMLAGSSDTRGGAVVEALAHLIDPNVPPGADGHAACLLLLEDEADAAQRVGGVHVAIEQILEWRGSAAHGLAELRGPSSPGATVFIARPDHDLDAALAVSSWARCARRPRGAGADSAEGTNGLGTWAFLSGAASVARGLVREALVCGGVPGGGFAVLLAGGAADAGAGR